MDEARTEAIMGFYANLKVASNSLSGETEKINANKGRTDKTPAKLKIFNLTIFEIYIHKD